VIAALIGVRKAVMELGRRGELPPVKLAKHALFEQADVPAYLEELRGEAPA
jgi:hypothetical protein